MEKDHDKIEIHKKYVNSLLKGMIKLPEVSPTGRSE
jgi:hypothetical protein